MNETATNPFAGLKRKRLPGMHMISALQGGVPLRDALAAFFFMTLHRTHPHTCLIQPAQTEVKEATNEAILGAGSPDGMFLGNLFGMMADTGLIFEEWSYLPDEEVFLFHLMAGVAIEQVQRWIFDGVEQPYSIRSGNLVERPAWAEAFNARLPGDIAHRAEIRAYVERLRREIDEG